MNITIEETLYNLEHGLREEDLEIAIKAYSDLIYLDNDGVWIPWYIINMAIAKIWNRKILKEVKKEARQNTTYVLTY
jgi:hypothetical protein